MRFSLYQSSANICYIGTLVGKKYCFHFFTKSVIDYTFLYATFHFKYSHKYQSWRSRRDTRSDCKKIEYVYLLPFYSPPSTISSCRNIWRSARRRPARPKRIVCIRLARNCCLPRALTYNPIHLRPRNFTVSWNRPPAWVCPCSHSITARDCPMSGSLYPGIPAPSYIRPPYRTRRPERSNHLTACRICSSYSCSCTMHNCNI